MLKYINILVVTKTKLDEVFLESHFLIDVFSKPYRLDRNKNASDVMSFICDTVLEKRILPNVLILENANDYLWII